MIKKLIIQFLQLVQGWIRKLIKNPIFNLIFAAVLIYSSLNEAWPTLIEDIKGFDLGGHHGVGFLGLWHVLRTLAELREPIEWVAGESPNHSCRKKE